MTQGAPGGISVRPGEQYAGVSGPRPAPHERNHPGGEPYPRRVSERLQPVMRDDHQQRIEAAGHEHVPPRMELRIGDTIRGQRLVERGAELVVAHPQHDRERV